MEIKILKDNSETLDELRESLIEVINKYSDKITGYELIGVIDVVRNDCHVSIEYMGDMGKDEDGG